jgi:hypothetical protein
MQESETYQWYPGIEPKRYNRFNTFVEANAALLESIAINAEGSHRRLKKVICVYDLLHNEWLHDLPIVLKVDDDFFSICNYGMGELSIGINNIDLTRSWNYLPGYFERPWMLEWREFDMEQYLPQTITGCMPISDEPIDDNAIMGIAFHLEGTTLEIVNGLDTNQIVARDLDNQIVFSTLTDIDDGVAGTAVGLSQYPIPKGL